MLQILISSLTCWELLVRYSCHHLFFAPKGGSCNRFGNCGQPNKTTTTPPLSVIVGTIIAVGVVLLVLLIVGAVPLVVCLMRRQERTKREVIGKVESCAYKLMFACLYPCYPHYWKCAPWICPDYFV